MGHFDPFIARHDGRRRTRRSRPGAVPAAGRSTLRSPASEQMKPAGSRPLWSRPPPAKGADVDAITSNIQRNGSWFIKGVGRGNAYYGRRTGDSVPRSTHEDADPTIDLVLMIKDFKQLNRDQLVARLEREIAVAMPQFRIYDAALDRDRSIHANVDGQALLRDFDEVWKSLRDMEAQLRDREQGRVSEELLGALVRAKGGPASVDQISASGLPHEWLRYVSGWFLTRLRYLHQNLLKNGGADNVLDAPDAPVDASTLELLIAGLNNRLHGPSIREDLRMVEWLSRWTQCLNQYETDGGQRLPPLNERTGVFYFENVYKIPVATASLMLSRPEVFAEDIELIENWTEYKAKVENIYPSLKKPTQKIHDERYMPLIRRLTGCIARWSGQSDEFARWSGQSDEFASQFSFYDYSAYRKARQEFTRYMDEEVPHMRTGKGRWCNPAPPEPGTTIGFALDPKTTERKAAQIPDGCANANGKDEDQCTCEGWTCIDHRPSTTCTNCDTEFRCALCSNPHTCHNCQAPYSCRVCGVLSYNRRADAPRFRYKVAEKEMPPHISDPANSMLKTARREFVVPVDQMPSEGAPTGPVDPPDRRDPPSMPPATDAEKETARKNGADQTRMLRNQVEQQRQQIEQLTKQLKLGTQSQGQRQELIDANETLKRVDKQKQDLIDVLQRRLEAQEPPGADTETRRRQGQQILDQLTQISQLQSRIAQLQQQDGDQKDQNDRTQELQDEIDRLMHESVRQNMEHRGEIKQLQEKIQQQQKDVDLQQETVRQRDQLQQDFADCQDKVRMLKDKIQKQQDQEGTPQDQTQTDRIRELEAEIRRLQDESLQQHISSSKTKRA
ncbi:hypothetical protein F4778DRAFT_122301 [Xylariomycetidae sp. FL2044]|nr:hypothetical protein F4778DRAFT_122301 [Xylariomycetidae sp. FL2044]